MEDTYAPPELYMVLPSLLKATLRALQFIFRSQTQWRDYPSASEQNLASSCRHLPIRTLSPPPFALLPASCPSPPPRADLARDKHHATIVASEDNVLAVGDHPHAFQALLVSLACAHPMSARAMVVGALQERQATPAPDTRLRLTLQFRHLHCHGCFQIKDVEEGPPPGHENLHRTAGETAGGGGSQHLEPVRAGGAATPYLCAIGGKAGAVHGQVAHKRGLQQRVFAAIHLYTQPNPQGTDTLTSAMGWRLLVEAPTRTTKNGACSGPT